MAEIAALIAKLEALDGPSREVDALIWAATLPRDGVGMDGHEPPWGSWFEYEADERGAVTMYVVVAGDSIKRAKRPAPELTSSIDAAVALVERCLPGWYWGVTQGDTEDLKASEFQGNVWPGVHPFPAGKEAYGYHKIAPVAILLALLRAMEGDKP